MFTQVKLVVDLHPKIFEGVHPFYSTVMISVGNGFPLGDAHHLTHAGIQFKLPFSVHLKSPFKSA